MSDEDQGSKTGKFDAVQFGRLIESVENLKTSVEGMRTDVSSLKETRSKGLGILIGVSGVAGGLGSPGAQRLDVGQFQTEATDV